MNAKEINIFFLFYNQFHISQNISVDSSNCMQQLSKIQQNVQPRKQWAVFFTKQYFKSHYQIIIDQIKKKKLYTIQ